MSLLALDDDLLVHVLRRLHNWHHAVMECHGRRAHMVRRIPGTAVADMIVPRGTCVRLRNLIGRFDDIDHLWDHLCPLMKPLDTLRGESPYALPYIFEGFLDEPAKQAWDDRRADEGSPDEGNGECGRAFLHHLGVSGLRFALRDPDAAPLSPARALLVVETHEWRDVLAVMCALRWHFLRPVPYTMEHLHAEARCYAGQEVLRRQFEYRSPFFKKLPEEFEISAEERHTRCITIKPEAILPPLTAVSTIADRNLTNSFNRGPAFRIHDLSKPDTSSVWISLSKTKSSVWSNPPPTETLRP